MSTPESPDTLAIRIAIIDRDALNEAVDGAFRALALLKSPEPLAPDQLDGRGGFPPYPRS
jgi:hypothetical protein